MALYEVVKTVEGWFGANGPVKCRVQVLDRTPNDPATRYHANCYRLVEVATDGSLGNYDVWGVIPIDHPMAGATIQGALDAALREVRRIFGADQDT